MSACLILCASYGDSPGMDRSASWAIGSVLSTTSAAWPGPASRALARTMPAAATPAFYSSKQ